jgi:NADPH:quinone reductase-like Zn-dependent oxidoreductase
MRAALITRLGDAPQLAERALPSASDGELLIDVLASALNPIDIAVASGRFFAGSPPVPYVPGAEAVGRAANDADGIAAGTLVYVSGAGFGTSRDGGLAERAVAPAGSVVAVPDDADPATAVSLGIAGLAGWLPLAWRAPVRADDRVLILGATGVVGRVAVQAAKLLGAHHVTAAGRDPVALQSALQLGADAVVSLDTDDVTELARRLHDACGGAGPTYVFDPLWGPAVEAAVEAATPGARIVNLGQSAGPTARIASGAVRGKQLEIVGYLNFAVPADVRGQAHAALLDHARRGEITLATVPVALQDIAEHWRLQAAGSRSKYVVLPCG